MTGSRRLSLFVPLLAGLVLALPIQGVESTKPPGAAPPSAAEIKCPPGAQAAEVCEVDKETYFGWRTYAANCQVCHGGSGLGASIGPNLIVRFNTTVDYPRFLFVLENGFTGQVGAMPGWKQKRDVMSNGDNLYRYLRARADDALPPGRPMKRKS